MVFRQDPLILRWIADVARDHLNPEAEAGAFTRALAGAPTWTELHGRQLHALARAGRWRQALQMLARRDGDPAVTDAQRATWRQNILIAADADLPPVLQRERDGASSADTADLATTDPASGPAAALARAVDQIDRGRSTQAWTGFDAAFDAAPSAREDPDTALDWELARVFLLHHAGEPDVAHRAAALVERHGVAAIARRLPRWAADWTSCPPLRRAVGERADPDVAWALGLDLENPATRLRAAADPASAAAAAAALRAALPPYAGHAPDAPLALLARHTLVTGDGSAAVGHLQARLRHQPDDPARALHLARTLRLLGGSQPADQLEAGILAAATRATADTLAPDRVAALLNALAELQQPEAAAALGPARA